MAAGARQSRKRSPPETGVTMAPQEMAMGNNDDFTQLDDSALLLWRAEMRAELERLPAASLDYAALTALYDRSTVEVNERAREAWSRAS
jgi:hypothetical protein